MVVVHLRATGDAPILKQCKLKLFVEEHLQTQNTMTTPSNASDVGPSNLQVSTIVHRFEASFRVEKNVIEVPLSYHIQWSPNYPTYVLFDYKGNKHFIKLHKYADRFFFGNGLKELRRTHGIYESVIMRFVAWDKNTTFNVDVVGPLHRQTHQRSAATTRRYVFTIDVFEDMIQHNYQLVMPPEASNYLSGSKKYMIVDRGRGRLYEWMITMAYHAGDEVVFYYSFDQYLWEVLYRKQVKWDEEEDIIDST
ncbi:hypothetical protein HKD37_14G039683 [Glycine soja]